MALSIIGLYAGCTSNTETETTATTTTTVTGTGAMGPCFNNIPDGQCLPDGEVNAEPCECEDCTATAKCNDGCNDDGICDLGSEDCSCGDCFFKVPECSPDTQGCIGDDDGACQADEACTCGDCTDTPGCQSCDDNGVCNNVFEGCSCADCSGQCGSSGPGPTSSPASSSSAGGAGGVGGMGGVMNGVGGMGGLGGN